MTKITFEDLPSTNTPLSASNLNTLQDNVENAINNVEEAINNVDARVDLSTNAITILLSSDYSASITSAYTRIKIPFNNQVLKIGNKLTFDSTNNQIIIGSGVHHIEVSAMAVLKNGSSSSGDRYLYVSKNSSSSTIAQCYYQNAFATNYNYPVTVVPIIVSVEENDIIYATVSSGLVETLNVRGSSMGRTYLTIRVID